MFQNLGCVLKIQNPHRRLESTVFGLAGSIREMNPGVNIFPTTKNSRLTQVFYCYITVVTLNDKDGSLHVYSH